MGNPSWMFKSGLDKLIIYLHNFLPAKIFRLWTTGMSL